MNFLIEFLEDCCGVGRARGTVNLGPDRIMLRRSGMVILCSGFVLRMKTRI